jgi:hypothetical protein
MNSQQIGERISKTAKGGTLPHELEVAQALWAIAQQLALMNERQK